jgi:hypothetical protein
LTRSTDVVTTAFTVNRSFASEPSTKEKTHRLLADLWHRGHLLQDDGPDERAAESTACRDSVRFADGARLSSRRIPQRKAILRTSP